MQTVSSQWICKHVQAVVNMHTTIEFLLETVFSTRSMQSVCKEDNLGQPS
jgi:hypothetical protein